MRRRWLAWLRRRWELWFRRRWLLWLLLIGLTVLVITRFADVREVVLTLARGRWQWILAAGLLQGAYYVVTALLYHLAFAIVRVKSRVLALLPVVFTSVFVNTLVPSGGVSGAALFVDDAAQHGQSPARAAEGVLLVAAAENLALVPLLLAGLAYLASQQVLQTYQGVGALIFLLFIGALMGALLLGRWKPAWLRDLFAWLQSTANRLAWRIRRRPLLAADWADHNSVELIDAAHAVIARPRPVGRALVVAVGRHLINIATLYAIFFAFDAPATFGALAAGFALGVVFAVLSFLPLDIGLTQGIMALVFASLGIPTAATLAIVLAFGGLNAWLPIAISPFVLRWVRSFTRRGRP